VPELKGPIDRPLLEVPTLPVQPSEPVPPLAVHEFALLVLQARLVEPPV
jgi:hypothetical protein